MASISEIQRARAHAYSRIHVTATEELACCASNEEADAALLGMIQALTERWATNIITQESGGAYLATKRARYRMLEAIDEKIRGLNPEGPRPGV